MPVCEMCGTEASRLRPVLLEGTRLMLCENCAKFGTEIPRPERQATPPPGRPPRRGGRRSSSTRPARREPVEYDLVPDYPDRIRKAREARGWKREVLAQRIAEKQSVVEKLEKGKMRPDDALVAKLRRTLGVRLMEAVDAEETVATQGESRPLTLGDLIRREE